MNARRRFIVHIDIDAFFAAVETLLDPTLKGKPVIVGGLPYERGVASTCSYEARRYGVHTGMPLAKA
jgi:DNA polymerase-4